jgi:hypothetical protein
MNRRDLFGLGAAAAAGIAGAATAAPRTGRRVSVDPGDPGEVTYQEFKIAGYEVRVFLDGVEVQGCVTADEAEGLIIRHPRDEKGHPTITGDGFTRETLRGHVHIEPYRYQA